MEEIGVRASERGVPATEETWTGATFSPAVDIFETDEEMVLLADMPGVAKERVSIDLEDDRLTVLGLTGPAAPETETLISEEYASGRYLRRFALSQLIDRARISAQMGADGVLRLSLPKVKQAQPRKITVQTAH